MNRPTERHTQNLNTRFIRQALKVWHSLRDLGEIPLTGLQVVEKHRLHSGYSDTDAGRGLALREVLQMALDLLKPNKKEKRSPAEKAWRQHTILTEQYINGHKPDWIAVQLHIAKRTYFDEQKRALEAIVNLLCDMEEQAHKQDTMLPDPSPQTNKNWQPPFLALPKPPYSIIGQADLFNELKQQLLVKNKQVVISLTGLPGVGKTTIATEIAHDPDILGHFHDGVLWVGLGQSPNVFALLGKWAMALGVSVEEIAKYDSLKARAELIHSVIGMHHILLIIDDVWDIATALAFKLGGPNCAYLATTRLMDVALEFAENGTKTIQELSSTHGQMLLKHLAPKAVAADAEPEAAETLVHAVGGLPLALVLIGKYLRRETLGNRIDKLHQVIDRLQDAENRFKLIQVQSPLERPPSLAKDIPFSLQATIDLSYATLPDTAQQALQSLAFFGPKPNTFSEEAALSIADLSIDTINILVKNSLIENIGLNRYTIHQTIVDYIHTGPLTSNCTIPEKFISYFLYFLDVNQDNFNATDLEFNNLLTTLSFAVDKKTLDHAIELIELLHPFLVSRGLYLIIDQYLRQTEQLAQDINDTQTLAKISLAEGKFAISQGSYEIAKIHLQKSFNLAQSLEHTQLKANILYVCAKNHYLLGEFQEAIDCGHKALCTYKHLDNQKDKGRLYNLLGVVYTRQGNFEDAQKHLEESLSICHGIGDKIGESAALSNLGIVATDGHYNHSQARYYYEQSLTIFQEIGDMRGEGKMLGNLTELLMFQGYLSDALNYCQRYLQICEEIGNKRGKSITFMNLGRIYYLIGDYIKAKNFYSKSLLISREIGNRYHECVGKIFYTLVLLGLEDYQAAQENYLESLSMVEEFNNRSIEAYALTHWGHVLISCRRLTEAVESYKQALEIRTEMKHTHLAMEILAALAHSSLLQGDTSKAQTQAREVANWLQDNIPEGLEDPFRIYYNCYHTLKAIQDPVYADILNDAKNLLQEWANRIRSPELRRSFLEEVNIHQEILHA